MKIILIGFMGSGKSTISKELSKILNLKNIDMDCEIENKTKLKINEIFEKYGEEYFRKLETKMLKEIINDDNIIISTGGGIINSTINLEILKNTQNVIFLDANEQTIMYNLKNEINNRPLLKNSTNIEQTIKNLIDQRYNKYMYVADKVIDVNKKNINEIIKEIINYTK